jgi:hypothetical protein
MVVHENLSFFLIRNRWRMEREVLYVRNYVYGQVMYVALLSYYVPLLSDKTSYYEGLPSPTKTVHPSPFSPLFAPLPSLSALPFPSFSIDIP